MGVSGLATDTPTFNQTGGTATTTYAYLGFTPGNGLSTVNLSGGTFNVGSYLYAGYGSNCILNINGGSLIDNTAEEGFYVGNAAGVTATINLSSGIFNQSFQPPAITGGRCLAGSKVPAAS